jgi:uncharacterized protein (DUF58 family)
MKRLLDRLGLTTAGALTLALLPLVWLVARLLGSRTLYLLAYGGVLVLLSARYLGRRRAALDARRSQVPARVRQGQRFPIELTVASKRRLGSFVIEDDLHPHLGRSPRVPFGGLGRGASLTHTYVVTPRLRGVYKVGPLRAVWTDPFGLTRLSATLVEPIEIIVHPSTEQVTDRPLTRQWEDPPIRPPFSKPWPSGFEFYGMRAYEPGDDLRRIVWRAVARTGKVLVRESEQGITDKVRIVLDNDERFHSPGEASDTFEAAVKTVASLATRHLRDGFAVSIEANDRRLVNAARGSSEQLRMLDELARVGRVRATVAEAIDRLVIERRYDDHLVIVTPHLDDQAAARMKLLVDRSESVVLVVLMWEETDLQMLAAASVLGCEVLQLRPQAPLAKVFAQDLAGGRR